MRLSRNKQQGAITLVALCFTAVVGIALATYISLCYRSLDLSHRTVQLNRSRHYAEVGLEEALWALNNSDWTNGWTPAGSNMTQTFSGYSLGQGATAAVAVTVANYATTTPTITAAATVTLSDGQPLVTTYQATTKPAPVFGNAIASINGRVRFRNLGTVDSYNSTVGAYGGANVGYAAVVAGGSTSYANPVTIAGATINGYAATVGNVISYTTGKIKGPTTPGGTNIDTTRIGRSAFIPRFSIVVPTGAYDWLPGPSATIATGYSAPGFWYFPSDYTIGAGQTLTIDGPAKILVDGTFAISSTGELVVTVNGSLELFVRGNIAIGRTTPGDTGGFRNNTNLPRKLAVFVSGTTTNTYSVTSSFTGVIFADTTATSAISFTATSTPTSPTIYGAILAYNNVDLGTATYTSTNPTIHYDIALRDATFTGISTPFIINVLTQL
jgi:hypothetical protein